MLCSISFFRKEGGIILDPEKIQEKGGPKKRIFPAPLPMILNGNIPYRLINIEVKISFIGPHCFQGILAHYILYTLNTIFLKVGYMIGQN